jgi:hypothetical protein
LSGGVAAGKCRVRIVSIDGGYEADRNLRPAGSVLGCRWAAALIAQSTPQEIKIMTIKTRLIVAAALAALLSAPASARPGNGGEEGFASAFPRFTTQMSDVSYDHFVNRPRHRR